MVAPASSLVCTSCGAEASSPGQACDRCFGPLALDMRWHERAGTVRRDEISRGPASMWRYAPLLPAPAAASGGRAPVGWTPLVPAPALGDALGVDELWVKDETANPSGSFKDRVVATALAAAPGAAVAACASTGNLAWSLAWMAPLHGARAVVLVPDALGAGRVDALRTAGATVVAVEGPYDAANRLSVEAAMDGPTSAWAWVNVALRPWYVAGAATIGYEIVEQLAWGAPGDVVAPAASGAMALQIGAAVDALRVLGLVAPDAASRLSVAQPSGCAPIARAAVAGRDDVEPVQPATAVSSLAMGDPPDARALLAHVRRTGGAGAVVDEAEVDAAAELVESTTGIAVERAGGVVAAAVRHLAGAGRIGGRGPVVAVLSGGPPRPAPAAEPGPPAVTIPATLAALQEALAELMEDPAR